MKGTARAARLTAAIASVGLLVACSSGVVDPAPVGSPGTPAGSSGARPGSTDAADPVGDEPTTEDHADLETPGTSSGPLTRRDFPTPRELGAGWSYRVDMGDAEEGYTGNRTPVLERDPAEVAMLAVPFGCPRPVDVPVPEHALEVDYTAADVSVVAVRASFGDPRTASRFFGARARLLHGCEGTVASGAEGVLVAEVRRLSATTLLNDRTPESDPWAELAVHDGDQVVLVAAGARLDSPPMTPSAVADLARAFRR